MTLQPDPAYVRRLSTLTTSRVCVEDGVTWLADPNQSGSYGKGAEFALAVHELQALVQWAYDVHRIVATPSDARQTVHDEDHRGGSAS
ncbi:MAG: hypothetical protein QM638_01085 [Nocardioides sp.]|uniref:hypothetical protein n=1 Tax=Nocardioides sp. TaxID=35761 RepID=UPI0039E54E42